ncbi:hypothetical protein FB45DRAFT_1006111 [Roridomyces roridus]|uniref:Secreted protein n=1 Tax=Roridomyces roridus TaxID=1738132 RepID=A0AAD7BI39_9AGAR|nr:hypothetical protein FB45DRAFT_1006111 [Roridomyces roridus]
MQFNLNLRLLAALAVAIVAAQGAILERTPHCDCCPCECFRAVGEGIVPLDDGEVTIHTDDKEKANEAEAGSTSSEHCGSSMVRARIDRYHTKDTGLTAFIQSAIREYQTGSVAGIKSSSPSAANQNGREQKVHLLHRSKVPGLSSGKHSSLLRTNIGVLNSPTMTMTRKFVNTAWACDARLASSTSQDDSKPKNVPTERRSARIWFRVCGGWC